MDKPQIIAHVQKSLNYTLFDCKWIPSSAKFVVLGQQPRGTGTVQTYEVSHGELKLVKEVRLLFKAELSLDTGLKRLLHDFKYMVSVIFQYRPICSCTYI